MTSSASRSARARATCPKKSLETRPHAPEALDTDARLADEHGGQAPEGAPELEFEAIAELVDRYHGVADTQKRAEEHIGRALEAIAPFPEGPAKEALFAAAKFSVLRDR